LLEAMARNEKPWEDRIKQRQDQEKASKKKGKRSRKSKSTGAASAASAATETPQEAAPEPAPAVASESAEAAPEAPKEPAPTEEEAVKPKTEVKSPTPAPETGTKRKFDAVESEEPTNGHAEVSQLDMTVRLRADHYKAPATTADQETMSPTTVKVESPTTTTSEKPAKRAKSSSAGPVQPVVPELATTLAQLPPDRQPVAKALFGDFKSLTNKAIKENSYTLPPDVKVDAISLERALALEHSLFHKQKTQETRSVQFRSIKFNLKKNKVLLIQILDGTLSTDELATMASDEMADEKLQKEREKAKEEADKHAILAHETGPRYRKTHKGDELIGEEPTKPSDSVYTAPVRRGTIDQGQSDTLVDRGSPPPVPSDEFAEEPAPASPPKTAADTPAAATKARPVDPAKAGMRQAPRRKPVKALSSPVQSDVVMGDAADDADFDRILNADEASTDEVVWRGRVSMADIGIFGATARFGAGGDIGARIPYHQLIKPVVEIEGRIAIQRADEYVASMRHSTSTDVTCLTLTPLDGESDQAAFAKVFKYFKDRQRWGVFQNHGQEMIRDVYLVTLPAGGPDLLPTFLTMLEQNKIPAHRPRDILLLVLVVRKAPSPVPATPVVNTQNPTFSPVAPGTPFGPGAVPGTLVLPQLATQILGQYAACPVVAQMGPIVPEMTSVQLQNLRDILEKEPATRASMVVLGDHLAERQRMVEQQQGQAQVGAQ